MASFNVIGIDALIEDMQLEAERIDRNGPDAVMAGAKVAIEAMRKTVPEDTGGLKAAIQAKKPTIDERWDGHFVDVFPDGKNKYGERYAEIGFVLEYGRSNMRPRPWMRPAVENEADAINDAMVNVLMRD